MGRVQQQASLRSVHGNHAIEPWLGLTLQYFDVLVRHRREGLPERHLPLDECGLSSPLPPSSLRIQKRTRSLASMRARRRPSRRWPPASNRSRESLISEISSSTQNSLEMNSRQASRLVNAPPLLWQAATTRSSCAASIPEDPPSKGRYCAKLWTACGSSEFSSIRGSSLLGQRLSLVTDTAVSLAETVRYRQP